MHLVVYLATELYTQLRSVLGSAHRITEATAWTDVEAILSREQVDVIVADPAVRGTPDVAGCSAMIEACHQIPILLYTRLRPGSMQAIAALGHSGISSVVLYRYDDGPERFRTIIERAVKSRIGHYIVERIADQKGPLPPTLAKVVKRVFETPEDFLSVKDIANAANVSRAHLYRTLLTGGFSAPRRILVAARVLRAHTYMRERGTMVRDVAFRLGYSDPRFLSKHTQLVLGVKPHQLGRLESEHRIVEHIVQWLTQADDTS